MDTLMARPFDAKQLRFTDEAVPLVDRVRIGAIGGNFGFSASDNGVLTYVTYGLPETPLSWVSRPDKSVVAIGPKGEYGPISIGPDGAHAAVQRINQKTGDEEIWIIDLLNGSAFRLTTSPPRAFDPVWSPDGSRVAFERQEVSGFDAIFARRATGSGPEEPLLVGKLLSGQTFLWDWSADGRSLLLGIQEGTTAVNNLWTLSLGDRQLHLFLKSAFNKTEARFSPDGRWIAYTSDESGTSQVYVQSFPDARFRTQLSISGGSQPRWRRDGRELFYLATDRRVMGVEVRSVPRFTAGATVGLFELPNPGSDYDVNASGQRILITRGVREMAPSPIHVLLNWTAGLKK
jgi:eukaryotic-like serine/threonine-protein kinase